jgi:hypothetical protein
MNEDYHDRWIDCDGDGITIRWYYFPFGSKRIPYDAVRAIRRVQTTVARGKGRLWGTANPRYWASLDPGRPRKRVGFILDIGKSIKPFLTPDDPSRFAEALAGRTHLSIDDQAAPGPLI